MLRPIKPQGTLFQVHGSDELQVVSTSDKVVIKSVSFDWGGLLFSLPFVAFSLLFIGAGIGGAAVGAYGWWMAGEQHCVFSDDEPLFSGDGTAHCLDSGSQRSFETLEASEDRFRYSNGNDTVYFRWSTQGDYIVVAEIREDGYADCDFYRPASTLPMEWSTEDLTYPYMWSSRPSWCDDIGLGNDEDFTSTQSAPFDGERLYQVFDMTYSDVYYLEFTNTTVIDRSYLVDANDGLMGVLFPLIFSGVGLFMLRAVNDFRNFQLTFNRPSNSIQWHKAFAGTRFSGWNWEDADLTTLQVKRTSEEVWYSGHHDDDDGYYETKWGDRLSVDVGGAEQALVFFIGPSLNVHQDPFLVALAQAVGIDAVVRIESEEEDPTNPDVPAENDESTESAPMDSFWNRDDSGNEGGE